KKSIHSRVASRSTDKSAAELAQSSAPRIDLKLALPGGYSGRRKRSSPVSRRRLRKPTGYERGLGYAAGPSTTPWIRQPIPPTGKATSYCLDFLRPAHLAV